MTIVTAKLRRSAPIDKIKERIFSSDRIIKERSRRQLISRHVRTASRVAKRKMLEKKVEHITKKYEVSSQRKKWVELQYFQTSPKFI